MDALRERIDHLLELDVDGLRNEPAAELEEVVHLGFAAVQSGELWIAHVQRELAACGDDPGRFAALHAELRGAEASLLSVRERVIELADRVREAGIGPPAQRSNAR